MTVTSFGDPSLNQRYSGTLPNYPPIKTTLIPAWQDFAIEHDQTLDYVASMVEVGDLLADEDLIGRDDMETLCAHVTAVCFVESRLRQYNQKGNVVVGDQGAARGIAQLHPLWESHFGLERDVMRDSLEMCARLLLRGGWSPSDAHAQDIAFSYYNTGKRKMYTKYRDKVRTALSQIEDGE